MPEHDKKPVSQLRRGSTAHPEDPNERDVWYRAQLVALEMLAREAGIDIGLPAPAGETRDGERERVDEELAGEIVDALTGSTNGHIVAFHDEAHRERMIAAIAEVLAESRPSGDVPHDVFADPVGGGWDGFQAACHDCSWRGTRVWKDKTAAFIEAQSHRPPVASGESAEPVECSCPNGCQRHGLPHTMAPASAVPVDGDKLVAAGDLLQSSASRMAEWITATAENGDIDAAVPYEVAMAAHEAAGAVSDWTLARLSSMTKGGEDG